MLLFSFNSLSFFVTVSNLFWRYLSYGDEPFIKFGEFLFNLLYAIYILLKYLFVLRIINIFEYL